MPRTSYRWSCPACRTHKVSRQNLKRCVECGYKGWWDQVGRAHPFQTRKFTCPSCQGKFSELMDQAGRPPIYCPKCRKDFRLYPGSMKLMRREIKAGRRPALALKDAHKRVIEHKLGTMDEG